MDAPSGTALALADSINEAMENAYYYKYDRASQRAKRDPKEIGIQSVRGGSIVGDHDVIFAGQDEVVLSATRHIQRPFLQKALFQRQNS